MSHQSTCWGLIRGAAHGDEQSRSEFARCYLPIVRRLLAERWRGTPHIEAVEDAEQEVFLECFKPQGVLVRATPEGTSSFRMFLFGVVRNVARRFERASHRHRLEPADTVILERPMTEETPSRVLDRDWARAVVRDALSLMARRAESGTGGMRRRFELLRMRCAEGLAIRDIAARWDLPSEVLYRSYRQARREFRSCVLEVLARAHPDRLQRGDHELRDLEAALAAH